MATDWIYEKRHKGRFILRAAPLTAGAQIRADLILL
jgi:hypothetical protein